MHQHLIRRERQGGYWLIRDQGRSVELSEAGYALMARLHATGGRLGGGEYARLVEPIVRLEGRGLPALIEDQGLGEPEAWAGVRHVPRDAPRETLPADAAAAPKRIYFEITRRCNLACRTCFNNSHHALPGELTVEEILEVNRQAWELGVFEIRYTGGECTIVPGFAEIVADARRRGFYVSIGSNGIYTDEQFERLSGSGIDLFIISLDGDRETNDRIRGRGTFDRVLRTLTVLSRRPAVRLRLNMVVARHNLNAIAKVARIAGELGVGSLNLIPLRPYGRSTAKMVRDMLDQHDFYRFIREVNRLRDRFPAVTFSTTIDLLDPAETTSHDLIVQKKTTCAAGVEACVVGPQGHVYGCSYSPASFPDSADQAAKRIFIAGNLRDDDLRTIWRDSERWQIFRDLTRYKNPKCHTCEHYAKRCVGSCQIMAWSQLRHEERKQAARERLGELFDPYCFVDLLDERRPTADLEAPCGGAGMDS